MAVPREAGEDWLDRQAIRAFRRASGSQGLHRARRADGRCDDRAGAAQRNSRDENDQVKTGATPEDWKKRPSKNRQKDKDARWTKKHGRSYFGYKNHVNADARHKLIRDYTVSDASEHDSQKFDELLSRDNTSKDVYADSAYRSAETERKLRARGFRSHIHKRGRRNRPLTEAQGREPTTARARCAPVSSTCSGRRRMRPAVNSSARSASCVRRSRSGFKTSPTTSADWCFWSAPPPHDRSSPSTHPADRQETKKVLPAPTKPRRNHKTSASMARPSLTGAFFEVPLWLLVISVSPEGAVAGTSQPRPAPSPPRLLSSHGKHRLVRLSRNFYNYN